MEFEYKKHISDEIRNIVFGADVEELDDPGLENLLDFEEHYVWRWLVTQVILWQREATAIVMTGRNIGGVELGENEVNKQRGVYEGLEKPLQLLFSLKEQLIETKKEKQDD